MQQLPTPPGDKDRDYKGDVDWTGRIWVGQVSERPGFFGFWNGKQWEEPAFAGTVAENYVWFGFDRDGGMTALNSRDGILKIKDNQIVSRVPLSEKLPETWAANFDSRNNLWISSVQQGLYRISPDGQEWTPLLRPRGANFKLVFFEVGSVCFLRWFSRASIHLERESDRSNNPAAPS
ncbi:MAG: hypothetical protein EXS31_18240, partial [Pedosphaera sp.]|nr:hypothetical protein [Pedosphaera sp.]